jgi:transcriptional regulator with XRE-family HTH domain
LEVWRKEAGITQREAADFMDVSFTYISKAERDHLTPSVKVIEGLGFVYKRNPAEVDEAVLMAGRLPSWVAPLLTANPYLVRGLRLKRSTHAPFAQRTPPEYA